MRNIPFFKGKLLFNSSLSQGYLLLAAPFLKGVLFVDTLFQRYLFGQALSQRCGAATSFYFFEKGTDSFWEGGIQGQALVRNPAVTFTWASDAVDLNALLVAFLEDVHPILKDGGAAILFAQGCFPTSTSSFCSADEGHLGEPILFFKSGKHFFSPVGEAPGANHNFNPLFQE